MRFPRAPLVSLATLLAAGCATFSSPGDGDDAGGGCSGAACAHEDLARRDGPTVDLAATDLAGQSTTDLATPDLSIADLAPPDLATRDLEPVPDLEKRSDLANPFDLTSSPDLAPKPDLAPGPCNALDCGNPNCNAACVADAPNGWTGPFALYDGAPAKDPGCPNAFPNSVYQGNNGLSAPAAQCSQCGCGAATGATCQTGAQFHVGDAACGGSPNCQADIPLPNNWNGACDASSYLPGGHDTCGPNANLTCSSTTGTPCNLAINVDPLVVSGGSCAASGGAVTKPSISWTGLGSACGGQTITTTGCNNGQHCQPRATQPFQSGLCIQSSGVKSCPAGPFTTQHVFYTGAIDTRACTACSCGSPTGQKCTGTITFFSMQQSCAGAATSITIDSVGGGCGALANNPTVGGRTFSVTSVNAGTCLASGGQPAGSTQPDPSTATTFCCVP